VVNAELQSFALQFKTVKSIPSRIFMKTMHYILLRLFLYATILVVTSTTSLFAGELKESSADSTYKQLAKSFINAEIDTERVANISNVTFKRDVATFTLNSGKLYWVKPIASRTVMAVFLGNGRFTFTPPTTVEREQLERAIKSQSADISFTSLVLLFADTTFNELSRKTTLKKDDNLEDATDVLKDNMSFISNAGKEWIDKDIASCFLEKQQSDLFYSFFIDDKNSRHYHFAVSPDDAEEISFAIQDEHTFRNKMQFALVNQFHRMEDYQHGIQMDERKDFTTIDDYVTSMNIEDGLSMAQVSATLTVTPRYNGRRWLRYRLSSLFNIDSIQWDKMVNSKDYMKIGSELWIRAKEPLKKGVKEKITITYSGKIFDRIENYIWMTIGSTMWYPRNSETERSTFTMKFTIPENYKLWAGGDLIEESKTDGTITTVWKVSIPAIHNTFSIGLFKEKLIEDKRIPPVRLLYGLYSKMQQDVANDLLYSLIFYSSIFGKPPFDKMTAAELYESHGQAFPGFLQLSYYTFQTAKSDGSQESFVAHEMAHQWWGMALGWTNYHDQWISEAFSEYSSLMYMQSVLKDNDKFFKRLKKFKTSIMNSRKSIFGDGIEQAPIWLGWRTATSSANQGDYSLLIYKKGAWVLHMLRNMMMDLNTFSDERFLAMLKDFYTTYYGKDPTTQDFQAIVEKHTQQKMDWFFNQWIYGSKIPKYKVAYQTTQTPEGKFKVRMRIITENVPSDFMMVIPVLADFGDKGSAPLRIVVKGNDTEFDLPLLPMEPKKINFNILESVLCDHEMVDWE
jgi:hypothetical protein